MRKPHCEDGGIAAHCLVTVVSNQDINGEEKVVGGEDATLDTSAVTNDSLGRTRGRPWWHLCCSYVVEAEDDWRNPNICEEEEERFLLFFQPWQAVTVVRGGSVKWRYDVGVAVGGTMVIERDATCFFNLVISRFLITLNVLSIWLS